ncbi:hypothetical protein [Spirosoma sp.]|uniref:hypothetical protein n=1 Tax=Spirosoma sp. TaxID=1899569 RepID=UPI003B3A4A05
MPKILLLLLIGLGGLLAFAGYWTALIDWVQDVSGGVYRQNFIEAMLETSGLVIYTYLGVRFFNRHLGSSR